MYKLWNNFIRTDSLLLAVLLISTTLLLAYQGLLSDLDKYFYDAYIRNFKSTPTPDTVLLTIDGRHTEKLSHGSKPGEYLRRVVQQIEKQKPRSISFGHLGPPDINNLLDFPGIVDGDGNEFNIRRNIPGRADSNNSANHAEFQHSSLITAPLYVTLIQDTDGIVRSALLTGLQPARWDNEFLVLNKTVLSSMMDSKPDYNYKENNGDETEQIFIPYSGTTGHYPQVSYEKIENGEVSPDVLSDKYVIVGQSVTGGVERFPVPTTGFADPMPDIEIMANILNALRQGNYILPVYDNLYLLFSGMFALVPFLLFTYFTPRINVFITILLAATVLGSSVLLLKIFDLWLPPAAALTAVMVSYLMWSSRRLQNAVNYLDRELAHLNEEMAGEEVDPTSRLGTAFAFLEKILPITGWYIADIDGNIIYASGHKPRLSAIVMKPGAWEQEEDQCWTSIIEDQKKHDIGIRWHATKKPSIQEKIFLNAYLARLSGNTVAKDHETIEVVNKLITQVQKAHVNQRAMHEFFDNCIAQMADGLLVTNEFGKVLFANERAAIYLQGHSINNPAGRDIFQLLSDLRTFGQQNIRDLLRKSYLERVPVNTNAGNRKGMELLMQITPMFQGKRGMDGIIITLSDISYLKAIENARNETISFVSHDLRSPLVSILALLELLKEKQSPVELKQLHKRIAEYTKLTINMAEQFIQLTRVESDAEINLEVMDIVSTAINAYEQVWFQAQSKNIKLERKFVPANAWVKGDIGLLERSLINLLNNAIKYSPEGSTVRMNMSCEEGYICCSVEDQGYGIPEQELSCLFDRFHRAHRNKGVDEQGIGLGLALVKATAERHGGKVEVSSREGHGARFCLKIPEIRLKEKDGISREEPDPRYLPAMEYRRAL